MASFGERLKELRSNRQITQKNFAGIIGINERSYQNYEINASTPNYKTLIFIADYFNVSLDYLTGRSDIPEINH
jgi:transcriptional regulator with XRE-family HTH domain